MNGITSILKMDVSDFEWVHLMSDLITLTLAHFIWQGVFIGMLLAFANFALRRGSANARYTAAVVALFALLACPILTSIYIESLRLIPSANLTQTNLEAQSRATSLLSGPINLAADQSSAAEFRSNEHLPKVPTTRRAMKWIEWSSPIVSTLYLIGLFLMCARLTRGVAKGRACRTFATVFNDETIHRQIAKRCRAWSMRFVPAIACCQRVSVPVVVGVMRPMILIPPSMLSGFTTAQIESILVHELAHIRRWDPFFHLIQRIAESLLFFHPAAWYVSRRMNIEREIACDDFVIASGWTAHEYAATLLALADQYLNGDVEWKATLLAASGEQPSQFKLRILRLLGEERSPRMIDLNRWEFLSTLVLFVSASIVLFDRPNAQAQAPLAPSDIVNESQAGVPTTTPQIESPERLETTRDPKSIGKFQAFGLEFDVRSPYYGLCLEVVRLLNEQNPAHSSETTGQECEQNAAENVQADNARLHDSKRDSTATVDEFGLIQSVEIEGNSTILKSEIAKHIKIRPGRSFTQKQIKDDVDALVRTRWFASVEPTIRETAAGKVLVFCVLERPIVRRVEYKGLKKIKQKVFDNLTQLKAGSPYDVASNRECARRIEEYYHEKGFAFATVELEKGNARDDREIAFVIHEGPKVKVVSVKFDRNDHSVEGDPKTNTRTKTQIFWIFGEKYDPTSIQDEIAGVKRYYHMLGYFDVELKEHLKFSADKSQVEIHYEVSEGIRYTIRKIEIVGNKALSEHEIRGMMKVQAGVHYNGRDINKDVDTIKAIYGEQGRLFCRVDAIPRWIEEKGIVDLEYRIEEDKVYRVKNFNAHIDEDKLDKLRKLVPVDRIAPIQPGDLADPKQIHALKRGLDGTQDLENGQGSDGLDEERD